MAEKPPIPKLRGSLHFWVIGGKRAWSPASAVWAVLAAISPYLIGAAGKYFPSLGLSNTTLVTWILNHPLRVAPIGISVLFAIFLFRAPYELFKDIQEQMSKKDEEIERLKDSISEKRELSRKERIDGTVRKYLEVYEKDKLTFPLRILHVSGAANLYEESEVEEAILRICRHGIPSPIKGDIGSTLPKGRLLEFFRLAADVNESLEYPLKASIFRDKNGFGTPQAYELNKEPDGMIDLANDATYSMAPIIAGRWLRTGDMLYTVIEQSGDLIKSEYSGPIHDHSLTGNYDEAKAKFITTVIRKNIQNGKRTVMYGSIEKLRETLLLGTVYRTDGLDDLPEDFLETSIFQKCVLTQPYPQAPTMEALPHSPTS
ncbi:MAG: hypothetical protein ABSE62_03035 [Chthoniobacteraceae bacterium]|jgi:hypothetical protein